MAGAGLLGIPPEPVGKGGGQPAAWSPGERLKHFWLSFEILTKMYPYVFDPNCECRQEKHFFQDFGKSTSCVFDPKL